MMRYGHMDLKKGNYFPLPNCIFQLGLSPPEISIYAYLLRREDRESYQCRVPFKTIGAAVKTGAEIVVVGSALTSAPDLFTAAEALLAAAAEEVSS